MCYAFFFKNNTPFANICAGGVFGDQGIVSVIQRNVRFEIEIRTEALSKKRFVFRKIHYSFRFYRILTGLAMKKKGSGIDTVYSAE